MLTAAGMRAAEEAAVAAGTSWFALMTRAGEAVAEQVRRLAAGREVLVLCGPGNNGGDGYVAAAVLARAGMTVRVAASAAPGTALARRARAEWTGPVEELGTAAPAPVLVDALFGTGLSRLLESGLTDDLRRLRGGAGLAVAIDLPSGIATDTGERLGLPEDVRFDLTLALGAVKPAHLLQPGADACGAVRVVEIGLVHQFLPRQGEGDREAVEGADRSNGGESSPSDARTARHLPLAGEDRCFVLSRPSLPNPGPAAHKFSRGMVSVVAGPMAGASLLAAEAAMRGGAGYVQLLGGSGCGPHALVHRALDDAALGDRRVGAVLIGPGLGRDADAADRLDRALATDRALVIDGDALHLLRDRIDALRSRSAPVILTPHAGEFRALFGDGRGSKLDQARAAASSSSATVVFKGADTVIAAPDGRAILCPPTSDWLSTAGTGDVLAGAVAAQLAAGLDPLEAAAAGVWLHSCAARLCGPAFVADDLAGALTIARSMA